MRYLDFKKSFLKRAFPNKSLKAHYKDGNIFVEFFWQTRVKSYLRHQGSNPDPSESKPDAITPQPQSPRK